MKKLSMYLSVAFLAAFALLFSGTASAWDNKGWVKLGERTVNGKVDHDSIEVGKNEGGFTKLTLAVEKSELELLDFEVVFGNGEKWHPGLKHYFKEGDRTHVINLEGGERMIKRINITYKNLPGGGNAKLEVWGFKVEGGGHDDHHHH